MCDENILVISKTVNSQVSNNINTNEVIVKKENRKRIRNRPKKFRKSIVLLHVISLILLHALDAILLITLLPYIIWQWVSKRNSLKIILKSIVEVTGELIIWAILAGVSVFMTTIFVLEDVYFRKNNDKKLIYLSKEQQKHKIPEN